MSYCLLIYCAYILLLLAVAHADESTKELTLPLKLSDNQNVAKIKVFNGADILCEQIINAKDKLVKCTHNSMLNDFARHRLTIVLLDINNQTLRTDVVEYSSDDSKLFLYKTLVSGCLAVFLIVLNSYISSARSGDPISPSLPLPNDHPQPPSYSGQGWTQKRNQPSKPAYKSLLKCTFAIIGVGLLFKDRVGRVGNGVSINQNKATGRGKSYDSDSAKSIDTYNRDLSPSLGSRSTPRRPLADVIVEWIHRVSARIRRLASGLTNRGNRLH